MTLIMIKIGILSAADVRISFVGSFLLMRENEDSKHYPKNKNNITGINHFSCNALTVGNYYYVPIDFKNSYFDIEEVIIGRDFHWQQKETQRFRGNLILKNDGKTITVINVLPIEEYLKSVISSEMNPNAPLEFLKAHAIISRTWVMNRILNRKKYSKSELSLCNEMIDTAQERIRWYDDSQHIGFDVCADDHCQRYQGITKILHPAAIEAVEATKGKVLIYNGKIIDARFSKCCGGAFEIFENCWQPIHHPYLMAGADSLSSKITDLTIEENAAMWIGGKPKAFCNTSDKTILSQVLNSYDLKTDNFYRWNLIYSANQLSQIAREKAGVNFGTITDLVPIQRGVSGRIIRLQIKGTKRSMIIGKELEIRKTLSPSHLYSSAFTVKKENGNFILNGAGWGHGVGLCQIGAAMMANQGFNHKDILNHYYPETTITIRNKSDK